MVFACTCFSFTVEEEIENEKTKTHSKSTSTGTFYTACSHLSPKYDAKIISEFKDLTQKQLNHLRVFTLKELKAATENFSRSLMVGEGGFGRVYKGSIRNLEHPFDNIQVAVKYCHLDLLGDKEWVTEVNVLGEVKHTNLVKLVGYCAEDDKKRNHRLLVYEYMSNGSVRNHMSSRVLVPLSWTMRLKVAQDTARGLAYLHEDMNVQIIARDFKSSNILLDDQWSSKLSDFGVARVGPEGGLTHVSTTFVGTREYSAPEYLKLGQLSSKCDVWSYGVLLCELITGKRPQWLTDGVRPYLASTRVLQIVDTRLDGRYSFKSLLKLSTIAERCLSRDPSSRPKMSEVLEMVNQLIVVPSQPINPRPPVEILVPPIAIKWKKIFMGKKSHKDPKHKGVH